MRTFTKDEQDLLVHLLKGGSVATSVIGEGKTTLDKLILLDGIELELHVFLDDYQMHFNADELRIKELEEQLRIQSEELQKSLAKNKELAPTRKRRAHITPREVKEIEALIRKDTAQDLILDTYDISHTTYSRILNFKHSMSTIPVDEA